MEIFNREVENSEKSQTAEPRLLEKKPGGSLGFQSLSPAEAFAAIAIAAVASDGHVYPVETRAIYCVLSRMKLFQSHAEQELKTLLKELFSRTEQHSPHELVSAAKDFLDRELWTTAFAIAVDLVLSDGVLHQKEKRFLDHLQEILEVPEEMAALLIQAMLIKNKG